MKSLKTLFFIAIASVFSAGALAGQSGGERTSCDSVIEKTAAAAFNLPLKYSSNIVLVSKVKDSRTVGKGNQSRTTMTIEFDDASEVYTGLVGTAVVVDSREGCVLKSLKMKSVR